MKYYFFLTITLIFFVNKVYSQIVNVSPQKPEIGDQITIRYSGKLAKTGTKLKFIGHTLAGTNYVVKTIPSHFVDGTLIGSYIIPDEIIFFNIKVFNKNEIDNNDGFGFQFYVYEKEQISKGAIFAAGNSIKWNNYLFKGKNDQEKAVELMEQEYKVNPEIKDVTKHFYIQALANIPERAAEAVELAQDSYNIALETGNRNGLAMYYINVLSNGNRQISDSLKNLIITKYPTGGLSFYNNLNLMAATQYDIPDTAFIIYNYTINNFPQLRPDRHRIIDFVVLTALTTKRDEVGFENIINAFLKRDSSEKAFSSIAKSYNSMSWSLFESGNKMDRALYFAEKAIEYHKKIDTLSEDYGFALDTYASILANYGEVEKAIIEQNKAAELTNFTNSHIIKKLITYAIQLEDYPEALRISENFIQEGQPNFEIESLHKSAYFSLYKTNEGYDDHWESILMKSDKAFKHFIESKLVNDPCPDIRIKDLTGQPVNLTDFKGQVVILDFWATWCGPCLKTFPAMKSLISSLEMETVKFLFIDTKEHEESVSLKRKIVKTIEKYEVDNFHILIDEKIAGVDKAASAFKVEGIPAKFVIDKEGFIRFKSVGYSTDEKLIKELMAVVEMIK